MDKLVQAAPGESVLMIFLKVWAMGISSGYIYIHNGDISETIYVYLYIYVYIYMYIYVWMVYLIRRHWNHGSRDNYPKKKPYFGLVNYCNLLRNMEIVPSGNLT